MESKGIQGGDCRAYKGKMYGGAGEIAGGEIAGGGNYDATLLGAAVGGIAGRSFGSAALGALAGNVIDNSRRRTGRLIGGKECEQLFTKKYTERPSPPYPANVCKGNKKMGNDGKMWVSVKANNGVYRWMKSVKSPKAPKKKSPKKKTSKKTAKK